MKRIKSITFANAEPFLLRDGLSLMRGESLLLSVYEKVRWVNTDLLQWFFGFYLGTLIRDIISLT